MSNQKRKLTVTQNTVFKREPVQSSKLATGDKVSVAAGSVFELHSYDSSLEGDEKDHIKVALQPPQFLGQPPRNTWYVYGPHAEFEGTDDDNKPNDPAPDRPASGSPITLPGGRTVYTGQAIISGGHFTWGEATRYGARIPVDNSVVDGIIRVAKAMEEVRDFLGDRPITVNSWYRDPATNRRVGGARDSRHMRGDAVDFVVQGMHPSDVQVRLDGWWGCRGGLASASSFSHIDCRGVKARWRYGF